MNTLNKKALVEKALNSVKLAVLATEHDGQCAYEFGSDYTNRGLPQAYICHISRYA